MARWNLQTPLHMRPKRLPSESPRYSTASRIAIALKGIVFQQIYASKIHEHPIPADRFSRQNLASHKSALLPAKLRLLMTLWWRGV
jgi:hypothetical protein